MRTFAVLLIGSVLTTLVLMALGIDLVQTFGLNKAILVVLVESIYGVAILKAMQLDSKK